MARLALKAGGVSEVATGFGAAATSGASAALVDELLRVHAESTSVSIIRKTVIRLFIIVSRPFRDLTSILLFPALKRWAIGNVPSGLRSFYFTRSRNMTSKLASGDARSLHNNLRIATLTTRDIFRT